MRPQHTLLAALALAAGIASADPILPGADATATTAAIQAAIDAAVPSQGTVTLGAGLFEIDSQLMVTGGVTLVGQGWDSTVIKQTAATPSENTRVVTVSGGAKVERVTLTGGRVTGTNDKSGGGAYVSGGTVSWCCITNNSVSEANIKYGGGVGFSQGAGGQVDHCIIADNSVSTSTSDELGGGGIGAYRPLGPITIDSCLISGNRAIRTTGYGRGGGIGIEFIYQQNPVVVRNTTIVGNAAGEGETTSKGGAVFTNNDSGKKLTMIDCIVAGNTTAGAATTMALNYDGGVDYCFFDIEADKVGANSLFGDPQFVDSADGNYRLSSTSPAREAGATYSGIGVDLDGVDFGSPPSMGCYEAGGVAKVKAPVFFPASGTRFYPTTNATLSCETAGAAIYYTLDGSDPTDASTPYTGPIAISATTTVKARAYKTDMAPSAVVSATYVYKAPAPKPDGFLKCVDITLASALSETEITTGLPALVRLSESAIDGFDYGDFSLANGGDMMFVDEDGNPLPHEVDTWDESGESLVWVKLPSTAAGTTITMYYGNGAVSSAEPEDVWSNYVGVWHLNEANGNAQDATGHGLAAVPTGANAAADSVGVAGQVGNGRQMATAQGNKSYLAVANDPLLDCGDSLTFSGWFKATGTFANYSMRYVSRKNAYTDADGWEAEARYSTSVDNSATQVSARGSGSGDHWVTVPDVRANWLHLALVYSGTTVTFYVNGVAQTPIEMSGKSAADNDLPLAFGNNAAGTESNWVGFMDELRLSADARSADYAVAEYRAMNMSGTQVFTYGEAQEVGPETMVRNPVFDPASGATFSAPLSVSLSCATAGASIYYTTDGTDPTDSSEEYTAPIEISATTTIKARAYKQDLDPSAVVSATYTYVEQTPGIHPVDGDPAATWWTIQAAIDAAAPTSGTVVLAEGLFEIDKQLMITNGVTLVGQGWTNTVIRQTTTGKQSRCATLREGARLEGVTLTGGFVAGKWVSGAGALVEDGTISWCCISNNVAGVDRFDPAIDHVNNVYGAGVSIKQGSVDHTIFAYNEALASAGASHGGGLGVYCPTGDVLVDACLFYGNRAPQGHGGAIVGYFWNGINPYVLTVRNTTIVANEASATGGGIYITQNGVRSTYDFALVNSILADNVAGLGDPNLVFQEENNRAGYAAQSSYNLFANGTEALGEGSQSVAGSGAAWFVDPENEDYGIVLDCPAVEGGDSYEGLGLDLAGLEFSDPPSMGAYEYADRAAKPTFEPGAGTEFLGSIEVAIACATEGATIYYTTDGSRPTASSAVYSGPITLTERTTIKARAYAPDLGPSAVSTALFSDGTIPLEPIELGEPVSRPGRDFNGSTVTVDFTGDIPEGVVPTAKITIDGTDYAGTVDAENGTITIEVPATAVTVGNTYEATITLVVGDDEYTKTTVLEQGRPVIAEESGWIHETASTFESTGAWSGEKAVVADGAIVVSNATFTAATAAPGDAVVTITSTFVFGEPSDDAFETSDRAAITVIPVDGVARYAVATANGVATNLSVVAETASPVTVMVVMDCWAKKVSYSVDGMALGTYPMAEKAAGVSTMRYSGATVVTALDGTYLIERLDTNVAKAGDTEYPTVEEAVQSGKQPIELLWDASWDPTTPGVHTITTNGYDLDIGGDLDHAVTDNGDGTITVTVTDGTVHVRAKSITVGETTVLVGVDGIKAGRWYALEKTTDLSQGFVLDETTWTSATDLLLGTGELEIAIGENETCAFYQIRESDKAPNP